MGTRIRDLTLEEFLEQYPRMAGGAGGQMQGGGVFAWPDVPELGMQTWSDMSGMDPGHPLVGGQAGSPGYGAGQRQVAVADPSQTSQAQLAAGSPVRANWTEIFNLKGNPVGWVLIASILYLGLMHIHVRAGASAGLSGGRGK